VSSAGLIVELLFTARIRLQINPSNLTPWCKRLGEARLWPVLAEISDAARRAGAIDALSANA
jgi:hypothetical protein